MDLNDTPELAEYRTRVRAWLDEHKHEAPQRRGREDVESVAAHREWQGKLAAAGLAAVTWPAEFGGQGLGPLHQVVVNQEIGRAGVPGLFDVIGVGMLGPTLIAHGTEDQNQRHLGPMLAGEDVWVPALLGAGRGLGSSRRAVAGEAPRRRQLDRLGAEGLDDQRPACVLRPAARADGPRRAKAPRADDVRLADGRRRRQRAAPAPDLRGR